MKTTARRVGMALVTVAAALSCAPAHAATPRHTRVLRFDWVYTPTDANVSDGVGGVGIGCFDGSELAAGVRLEPQDCFELQARPGEHWLTLDARTLGAPVFGVFGINREWYGPGFCGGIIIPVEAYETINVSFTTVQSPRDAASGTKPCAWSPTGQLTATFR